MITRIQWSNHEVLGNLYLDLQKPDGTAYSNIVLVGENGCGKTTILNSLSSFLNDGWILDISFVEYVVDGKSFQCTTSPKTGQPVLQPDNFKYGCHYLFDLQNNITNTIAGEDKARKEQRDINYYGCVYSKARSGFKTSQIEFVRTTQLDDTKNDKDNSDDFTPIKQLLIDIESQDATEWVNISEQHHGADISSYESSFRMFRFKNAFNTFFDNIKYSKITSDSHGKKILFSKFGKEIEIDHLSTGEQQIVFRGAQLLRNSKSVHGGTVLIDEPELSMHPKWQEKVFQFYKNLFTENGKQTAQLFFATHSEAVLRSALADDDTLVVVLKNDNGVIKGTPITIPMVLPTITASEVNYFAFNSISTDYHIALFSYLQSREQLNSIVDADNFIKNNPNYDIVKHRKPSFYRHQNGNVTNYETLPVYIRNSIDHPENGNAFSNVELEISIHLLIELCK